MIQKRIQLAALYIDEGDLVLDIGTDHGYLGIEAYKRRAALITLVDNKIEPLNKAKLNTQDLIDPKIVEYLLSDGFKEINKTYDKIFILGLGGDLISKIIADGRNKIADEALLILDAHTKIDHLRKYLFDNSFLIKEEKIIKENNHYYEFIVAKKAKTLLPYNELDINFGPLLRKEKSPLFIEKWEKKLKKNLEILKNNPDVKNIIRESELIKEVI